MENPTPAAPPAPPAPVAGWRGGLALWQGRLSGRTGAVVAGAGGVALAVLAAVLLLRQPFGPPAELTLPRVGDLTSEASPGAGAPPARGPGQGSAGSPPPAPPEGAPPAVVTVHAAGAVARPGVYALPAGARVADLLTAAGGPTPEADLDRLNLAARVSDGERVSVARKGDPISPADQGTSGDGSAGASGAGSGSAPSPGSPATGPIDLNSATAEQLDTLPGVGPATARSIITYRQRHGRFRSVTELLEVPGIGPTKLEALRPLVKV